jgi:hypothetical protein
MSDSIDPARRTTLCSAKEHNMYVEGPGSQKKTLCWVFVVYQLN